jgi:hypothetical protein
MRRNVPCFIASAGLVCMAAFSVGMGGQATAAAVSNQVDRGREAGLVVASDHVARDEPVAITVRGCARPQVEFVQGDRSTAVPGNVTGVSQNPRSTAGTFRATLTVPTTAVNGAARVIALCRAAVPGASYVSMLQVSGGPTSSALKPAVTLNAPIVGMAATTTGTGYWLVGSDGGVFNFGNAGFYGSLGGKKLNAPIVGITPTPDDHGYWLVGADGGVFNFGDAGFYNSLPGLKVTPNKPIVGLAATPDGKGYWLAGADGGIYNFGDATFYNSLGGTKLNAPIVGVAATPDGKGYWMVGADGGVFNFGDAGFYNSLPGLKVTPNKPIVGLARTTDGKGYWLTGGDGGVYSFGDAGFHGSEGAAMLSKPVSGIAADPATGGYWLVAQDGGVFAFDAPFEGSLVSPAPTPPPSTGAVTTDPPATTSHYVEDLTGTQSKDTTTSTTDGCSDAKADGGPQNGRTAVIVVDYGGQTSGGDFENISSGVVLTPVQVVTDAEAYISGYVGCLGSSTVKTTFAIGTNNSLSVTAANGKILAASVVAPVASYAASKGYAAITVAGADDIEPGFGTFAAMQTWMPGYLASNLPLYDYGSADGCPISGTDTATSTCNNGWTVGDIDYVAGGADPAYVHALPEIYYAVDGTQWAAIRGAASPELNFAGAFSEVGSGTNSPADAWTDLFKDTGQSSLNWSTQITSL